MEVKTRLDKGRGSRLRLGLMTLSWVLLGCHRNSDYVHPEVPDVPIVGSAEARDRELPTETLVVPSGDVATRGLARASDRVSFGPGEDGTQILASFLERARQRGAKFVSDLRIYLVGEQDGQPAECVILVRPEDSLEATEVPGRMTRVSITRHVTKVVTEPQYECDSRMVPVTRTRTTYQRRCGLVSKPVTRTETTYHMEYDYSSKRSRSVPRTRSVTRYEMKNECHNEPQTRTEHEYKWERTCRTQLVTRSVTRPEIMFVNRFVPPHLENIQKTKLVQTEPACRSLPHGSSVPKNRIEGLLHLPND